MTSSSSCNHNAIGLALAAACLLAAVLGYVLGDPGTILRKAASVCLECIGVG